ncbi:MAG: TetR/AcrR family transcriptional regulator [Actinobacteria bacterium]|nr:TetR/AcrR family transcriptional regulator [Actinomycetota bacterium]
MPETADRVDPRAVRSQHRAIEAALELVREVGVGRVTMESIALRSGVAKTTLYRQFDDLETLLFAAFESLKRPQVIPDEHGVLADIEQWTQEFAVALFGDGFAPLLPAIIELAERSERGRELAVEFAARRRQAMQLRLERAVAAGELDERVDVGAVVSMIVGPLFYRRFISRQEVTPALVSQLVRSALASARSGTPVV